MKPARYYKIKSEAYALFNDIIMAGIKEEHFDRLEAKLEQLLRSRNEDKIEVFINRVYQIREVISDDSYENAKDLPDEWLTEKQKEKKQKRHPKKRGKNA